MMTLGRIHSIETFGTVDGPGVRLVVFTQGCPMRCLYCHNPDTWKLSGGTMMNAQEIIDLYLRNKAFYRNGGITVTGGEPLLQVDFLHELFTMAKKQGIHTCVDTSGIVFNRLESAKLEELMKVTDLVLLDIKQMNADKHRNVTSHSNENILDFARWLDEKNVPIWVRHVYVNETYSTKEDLQRLGEFLGSLNNVKAIDVLPYHTMGKVKYENLGIEYPLKDLPDATIQQAREARNEILKSYKKIKMKEIHGV